MLEGKVLCKLVGGRWALSFKASFWTLPILIFGVPIGNYVGGQSNSFWQWTLASVFGLIPPLILYILIDRTLFRNRHITPVPSWWVLALGFSAGFSKGIATGYAAQKIGLTGTDILNDSFIRGLNSGLIGMVVVPISSLFLSAFDRYITQRKELMQQAMQIQVQIMEEKEVTKGLVERIDASVMENLLHDLTESKRKLEEWTPVALENEWQEVAESLRSTAKNSIRPLSHLLWHESAEKGQESIIKNSLTWGLSHLPVYPFGALIFYGVSAILSSISVSGYFYGIVYLSIRLIILFALLSLLAELRKRQTNPQFWNSTLVIVLILISFELIGFSLHTLILMPSTFWGSIFDFFWILYILWIIGFVSAFLSKQEEIYISLHSFISQAELEAFANIQESRKISREIAKYLHGTIQSQLMGSAFAIEKAGRSGDAIQLEIEIKKAYQTLLASPQKYFKTNFSSLSESLLSVTANWKELMSIVVRNSILDPDASDFDTERIHNAIDDGLSNSFRHGASTEVIIDISKSDSNVILLIISDNGRGLENAVAGLGAQSFTSIAGKNWRWTTNSKGGVDLTMSFSSTSPGQG